MNTTGRSLRRAVAGVAVAAVTALVALVGAGPASAQEPPPGIVPEGHWTPAQVNWLVDWVRRHETTLPQQFPTTYSDGGSALRAQGYVNLGATAPGGYDHWTKVPNILDAHFLNPAYPEALLYQRQSSGAWSLKAALHMLPPQYSTENLPPLVSWIPGWHGHPELCVTTEGRLVGLTDPDNPSCPAGSRQATTPVMVHVWIEDSGCGHRFAGVGVSGLHCDVGHGHE
jgi:hypothetical protein